jgi:N6-adenosine-specific RNA methylase IME4
MTTAAAIDLLDNVSGKFGTILADPPWRFTNRTGKVAPEHGRLRRYDTMDLDDIKNLPVKDLALEKSHLYLWVPNAMLPEGLEVMKAWGFKYKGNIIWYKTRKDGGPDGRGVGFYFRNVTEILLFGVRGSMRTLKPGRTQVNIILKQKREHSRKPDEQYKLIESCSPGPYLEMFARAKRDGWAQWGDEIESYPETQLARIQNGKTYKIDSILKGEALFEVVEWKGVSSKPRREIVKVT